MRARPTLLAPFFAALAAAVALTQTAFGDYVEAIIAEDNAAPSIAALIRGDARAFADSVPAMGGVSLLWRTPFAALAGDDPLWRYRLGSLACLLAAVALATWLDRRLADQGAGPARRACTAVLVIAGPAAFASLDAGHPEEILGGALCAAACVAAIEDRRLVAAVLLGLAVGTKQWALLAVVPVLVAVGGGHVRLLLTAAGVTALFVVPELVASPERYLEVNRSIGHAHRVYPQSVWWPVAVDHRSIVDLGAGEAAALHRWTMPLGLSRSMPSILTLLLAAPAGLWWRRHARRPVDALGLLALLLMLRGVLDPMNLYYYAAPGLIALAAWDGLRARGLPHIALLATAATMLAWHPPGDPSPAITWALWAACTLPAGAAVLLSTRPRAARPPRAVVRHPTPGARGSGTVLTHELRSRAWSSKRRPARHHPPRRS